MAASKREDSQRKKEEGKTSPPVSPQPSPSSPSPTSGTVLKRLEEFRGFLNTLKKSVDDPAWHEAGRGRLFFNTRTPETIKKLRKELEKIPEVTESQKLVKLEYALKSLLETAQSRHKKGESKQARFYKEKYDALCEIVGGYTSLKKSTTPSNASRANSPIPVASTATDTSSTSSNDGDWVTIKKEDLENEKKSPSRYSPGGSGKNDS